MQFDQQDEAEGHANECLEQLDQWAARTSESGRLREIVSARLRVSDVLWRLGRRDAAIEQAQRSLDGLNTLATEPVDRSLRREQLGAARQLANDLMETKSFEAARPVLEQAAAWSEQLLAETAVEFAEHKSYVALQRNLALVEFHLSRGTEARRRLTSLDKHLRQLQADAHWTAVAEDRDWLEVQRREVISLGRVVSQFENDPKLQAVMETSVALQQAFRKHIEALLFFSSAQMEHQLQADHGALPPLDLAVTPHDRPIVASPATLENVTSLIERTFHSWMPETFNYSVMGHQREFGPAQGLRALG